MSSIANIDWKRMDALSKNIEPPLGLNLAEDKNRDAIQQTLLILAEVRPITIKGAKQHSAYWVKHQIEYELNRYISEGQVKLVWLYLNYPVTEEGALLFNCKDPLLKKWITRKGSRPLILPEDNQA